MSITVANLTSGSHLTVTSQATASVTPNANDLVLVSVMTVQPSGTAATLASLSGNGLSYVEVGHVFFGTGNRFLYQLFRAMGGSPSAGAITISYGGVSQSEVYWAVDHVSGVDTSGTNGSGAVLQPTTGGGGTTNATTLAITLSALSSAANVCYASIGLGGNTPITPATGYTEAVELSGTRHVESEYKVNDSAPSWSWTGSNQRGGLALELVSASADATVTPGSVSAVAAQPAITERSDAPVAPGVVVAVASVGSPLVGSPSITVIAATVAAVAATDPLGAEISVTVTPASVVAAAAAATPTPVQLGVVIAVTAAAVASIGTPTITITVRQLHFTPPTDDIVPPIYLYPHEPNSGRDPSGYADTTSAMQCLMRHYRQTPRGRNVFVMQDGTITETQPPQWNPGDPMGPVTQGYNPFTHSTDTTYLPASQQVAKVYWGGVDNAITEAEAASLTAAGYGANIH